MAMNREVNETSEAYAVASSRDPKMTVGCAFQIPLKSSPCGGFLGLAYVSNKPSN